MYLTWSYVALRFRLFLLYSNKFSPHPTPFLSSHNFELWILANNLQRYGGASIRKESRMERRLQVSVWAMSVFQVSWINKQVAKDCVEKASAISQCQVEFTGDFCTYCVLSATRLQEPTETGVPLHCKCLGRCLVLQSILFSRYLRNHHVCTARIKLSKGAEVLQYPLEQWRLCAWGSKVQHGWGTGSESDGINLSNL